MYSRKCRNGPSCHYLSLGTCWFYHPPEHMLPTRPTRPARQNYNPISSRSQYVFRRPSYFEDDDEDFGQYRSRNTNNLSRLRIEESENDVVSIVLQMLKRMRIQDNKEEIKIERKQKKEQDRAKNVVVNGIIVENMSIKSSLAGQKNWFFQKCHHFHYKPSLKLGQCSICINQYENKEMVTSLLCNHKFHNDCIEKWLIKSNLCPMCRKDFRQHDFFKSLNGYKQPLKPLNNPFLFF